MKPRHAKRSAPVKPDRSKGAWMELKLVRSKASALEADAVIVLAWEGVRSPDIEKKYAGLYDSGELTGKLFEFTLLHGANGFKAPRVLIAGAGKREKFDA